MKTSTTKFKFLIALALTCAGSMAVAATSSVHGEFGQFASGTYRAVVIDEGGRTGAWLTRQCDAMTGKCHESRSEKVKVRMTSDYLVKVQREAADVRDRAAVGVAADDASNWIGFQVMPDRKGLFHPSQGEYVRRKSVSND